MQSPLSNVGKYNAPHSCVALSTSLVSSQAFFTMSFWTSFRDWLKRNFIRKGDDDGPNPKQYSFEPPHPRYKS